MAGHDLTLNAGSENHDTTSYSYSHSSSLFSSSSTSTHDATQTSNAIGTTISGNNVSLSAGHDLTAQATQASATGAIHLMAGNDVNLTAAQNTQSEQQSTVTKHSGLMMGPAGDINYQGKRTDTSYQSSTSTVVGSTLSGDTVTVAAGHDLTAQAAQIAGTHDVTLAAGNNLTLSTANDTQSESQGHNVTTTGYMRNGLSVTVGQAKAQSTASLSDTTPVGSLVGSTNGSVTLSAGNTVHITGSDVLSQTGTAIVGKNVTIDAAMGSADTTQTQKQSSAGVTGGLGGGVATVAQTLYADQQGASHTSDSRLKALYAMQAAQTLFSPGAGQAMGLNGQNGAGAISNAMHGNGTGTGMSVRIGIGASSASSIAKTHDDTALGSQITSQGDVTIAATGAPGEGQGDLNVVGSRINGNNVALVATHDINLHSQAEQHTDSSTSHNGSGEVGVSIGQTTGIYLTASAGEALEHGNGTTHDNSVVNATNTLSLISGDDTTIEGAQAKGNTVLANIGGNLNLASEQDTNDYASHSIQAGITLVYGFSNTGVGVSGNLALSKANSNYASVTQMSGIGAGSGGYQINVAGNTNLAGAVIASTGDASRNLLSTSSLTTSNIQNEAKSSAESISVGGGYGTGQMSGMSGIRSPGIGIPQNSNQSSTTQAGIAQGTIVVRNNPTQDLNGLNRNPGLSDSSALSNTFDPQKIAENQQLGQLAGQVGMTAAGDAEHTLNLDNGSVGAIAIHAATGAAIAALGGGNATQGALGAAAGEGVIDVLPSNTDPALVAAASTLAGGLVGGGTGVSTALAGAEYNYLNHPQRIQEDADIASCQGAQTCITQKEAWWSQVSGNQNLQMASGLIAQGILPASLVEQLQSTDPQSAAYTSLLNQAVSYESGPAYALNFQLVNQIDGEPMMRASTGPTQAQINAINSALLGPVFGAPANVTLVMGGTPQQVAAANDFGGEAFGIATTVTELNPGAQSSAEPIVPGGESAVDPAALDTLTANGVKFTPADVVATGTAPDGQVFFLETGSATAGLQHIIDEHAIDFANIGVPESQIPSFIMQTVTDGNIVGYHGAGTGRPIYQVTVNGQQQLIAITVGSNGYVVGANPAGSVK